MQLPEMHGAGWVCHKFHNFQSTIVSYFENVKIKIDTFGLSFILKKSEIFLISGEQTLINSPKFT